ncbi:hypothetical protein C8Q79DRAFT_332134 [Trametes meyenii]|nr:hypothetical protein C8Q79DRAFT_332134 [Trametes meyenii]
MGLHRQPHISDAAGCSRTPSPNIPQDIGQHNVVARHGTGTEHSSLGALSQRPLVRFSAKFPDIPSSDWGICVTHIAKTIGVRKPDAYVQSSASGASLILVLKELMPYSIGRSIKPATSIPWAVFAVTTPFAVAARVPARPTWLLHFVSLGLHGVQKAAWSSALFSPLAAQAQNYIWPATLQNKAVWPR